LTVSLEHQHAAGLFAQDLATEEASHTLHEALVEHTESFPACTQAPARHESPAERNQQCAIDALLQTTREEQYL
jgi:hypothetical protein